MQQAIPQRTDNRPGQNRERTGAAAVEFALIAPLFLLFLAGIVEFGNAFRIEHSLSNACRRGARVAVTRGTTSAQVEQKVQSHCAKLLGVAETDVTVVTSLNGLDNTEIGPAVQGDEIMVSVSLPYSKASVGFFSSWFSEATLSSACIMERE
ncbi:MAG: pilus assembly protein [Planctomycetaceae bacterium]|nr:pilus assembly protein [Planctomycetaceae bacterium]